MKAIMNKLMTLAAFAFAAAFGLTAEAANVAQVGETKYETLAAAVDAAKTAGAETVTLLADCTVDTEVVVGSSSAKIIRMIEGTNSVAGGYYTITVQGSGRLFWDYDGWQTKVALNANVVDQTTAGNGLYLRGWSAKIPMVIAGSIACGTSDTIGGAWLMGAVSGTSLNILLTTNVNGPVTAGTVTGGAYYGPVTATTIAGGNYWGTVTAESISGGYFYGVATASSISGGSYYDVDDPSSLMSKVVSNKTLFYGEQGGTPYYSVRDISAVGATALRSGATINYENAKYALDYSEPNDVVTMVSKYWADLTLSNAVTLFIPTGVTYAKTVKACDSQHVIKATAIEGGTQYVNAVDPEAAVAYLVHGTTTNYCVTVAGAINDAVSGDEICLTKDCAEDLTLKIGVTVDCNGHSFTGTYTAHGYCVAVVDETAGTVTERYRESTDDDAVASLDATERTLYFAKVGAAVDAAYDEGTTVKLLKDVTLTDDDVQTSGGATFICKPIGTGKIFDGDGHTVTYTGTTVCNFITSLSGTITNAIFTGFKQGIVRDMHNGAAFANVKVTGTVQYEAWNWGAFADNVYADRLNNSCSFTDCEMAVDFTADSTTNGECHDGAFVGWLDGTNTLNFTRCRVTGNMFCGMAGMFIANVAYVDTYTLNVTDCYNEGLLNSVYLADQEEQYPYYFNPIVGYSSEDRLSRITVNLKQGDATVATVYTGKDQLTSPALFAALTRNDGDFVNGNVVASVTTAGDDPVKTYYADISNAFASATSGATVKLLRDIDLAGVNWKPVNFCGTFDGNNKTISNLTVTNYNMQYVGFFEEFSGVAKNVTFTGADISAWPGQGRAGVFTCVADSKYLAPTTISNVTVTASTVRGTQKCAGLVGFIRGLGNGYYDALIDIIDCHVNNVTLQGLTGEGMVQTGGLVGNVGSGCLINIISNTVSNITIDDKAKVKGYSVPETQFACHAFMGVLVNGHVPSESYTWGIAIFNGNTTDQCPESMVVRGRNYSTFIGDYANWDTPISSTKYLPTKLVVDGYEVTLARANVVSSDTLTTNTFATLQAAVNAVQEGETVEVLADNDEAITVNKTCKFTFNSNGYNLGSAPTISADGYEFVQNGDVCTYGKFVAQIGETKYESLAAAVAAATAGQTIKLLADCATPSEAILTDQLVLEADNVTLDLNGMTLTTVNNFSFAIAANNVVVKNGTINAGPNDDKITKTNSYALAVSARAIDAKVTGIVIEDVIMHGGLIVGAASNHQTECEGGAQVTIRNCDITSGDFYCVYGQANSDVVIQSGRYYGANPSYCNAVDFGSGTFVLKGGMYSSIASNVKAASGYQIVNNTDDATKTKYPKQVTKDDVRVVVPTADETAEKTGVVDEDGKTIDPTQQTAEVQQKIAEETTKAKETLNNTAIKDVGDTGIANNITVTTGDTTTNKESIVTMLRNTAKGAGFLDDAKAQEQINSTNNINSYVTIQLDAAEVTVDQSKATASLTAVAYDVVPVASVTVSNQVGAVLTTTNIVAIIPNEEIVNPITFRLPVADPTAPSATVTHVGTNGYATEVYTVPVQGTAPNRYVELSSMHFSVFIVEPNGSVVTDSEETLGLVTIQKSAFSTANEIPVATPFVASPGQSDVTVSNVFVAGFGDSDKIRMWNKTGNTNTSTNDYDTWSYSTTTAQWTPVEKTEGSGPGAADATTVARGRGIWYRDESGSTVPLTMAGLEKTGAATATTAGGMTLLVNPQAAAMDLLPKIGDGAAVGDKIMISDNPTVYEYNKDSNNVYGWGTWAAGPVVREFTAYGRTIIVYGDDVFTLAESIPVQANKAVWYVSKGGGSPTVNWD